MKSAVYSAEVLFMLEVWGLLDKVDAISSVSGGSFTAALYALSCDLDACQDIERLSDGSKRPEWTYQTVAETLDSNPWPRVLFDRLNPLGNLYRSATHFNMAHTLAEALDDHFYGGVGVTLAELNPRRPNLVLNATNMSLDRRFLEDTESDNWPSPRLIDEDLISHFAFTDYYFERLLQSNVQRYPLAYAVAGSAAFPLLIDHLTLARFPNNNRPEGEKCPSYSWRGKEATPDVCDFIHLLDGGVRDNHGITEMQIALREILDDKEKTERPPQRVLSLLIDSSLVATTGVSQKIPSPLGLDTFFIPLRAAASAEAYSATLAANAAQRKARWRKQLEELSDSGIHGRLADISITSIDDAPCIFEQYLRPKRICSDQDGETNHAWLLLPDAIGIGGQSRRCIFEGARHANTHYELDETERNCLRRAARWATALAMYRLCLDDDHWRHVIDHCEVFGDNPEKAIKRLNRAMIDVIKKGDMERLIADSELIKLPPCDAEEMTDGIARSDLPYWVPSPATEEGVSPNSDRESCRPPAFFLKRVIQEQSDKEHPVRPFEAVQWSPSPGL